MTALTREEAYEVSENLLRHILTSQPNLLKDSYPSVNTGQDVALFMQSFLDHYANYLLHRPAPT